MASNNQAPLSLSPPPIPPSQPSAPVRRHHTISSSSRSARTANRSVISEEVQDWDEAEDEYVGESWSGNNIGVVGEGKSLHRQASLPSRYNRDVRNAQKSNSNMAVRVNSLSAIQAEHGAEDEGEEEDWEKDMRHWVRDDQSEEPAEQHLSTSGHHRNTSQSSLNGGSPLSPMFAPPPSGPSPPPASAGANVRRHQSLTYGAAASSSGSGASRLARTATTGKRVSGRHTAGLALGVPSPVSSGPGFGGEEELEEHSDPSSPIARAVWGTNDSSQSQQEGWDVSQEETVDEIQRALGNLELAASNSSQAQQYRHARANPSASLQFAQQKNNLAPPPSQTPPRFINSPSPSPAGKPLMQTYQQSAYNQNHNNNNIGRSASPAVPGGPRSSQKLQLITDLSSPTGSIGHDNKQRVPASASAYVPPVGHGPLHSQSVSSSSSPSPRPENGYRDNGGGGRPDYQRRPSNPPAMTASGVMWDQKDRITGSRVDNNNGVGNANLFNPQAAFAYNQMYGNAFVDTGNVALPLGLNSMGGIPMMGMNAMGGMGVMGGLGMGPSPFGGFGNDPIGNGVVLPQQQQQGQGQQGQFNSYGLAMAPTRQTSLPFGGGGVGAGAGMANPNHPQSPVDVSSPVDIPSLIATKGYNPTTFDTRPAFARYFVIKSYTEDDVHKSLKYEIWSSTDPGNKRLDKAFRDSAGGGPIYLFFSVNASGHFCGMAEMLTPVDYTRSSTVWAQDKWKGVFKVRWIFVRDVPNAILRSIRLENTQERKPVTNSRDTQELLPEAGQEMLRIFFTHPARTSLLQDFAFYELQSMQKAASPPPQSPPQLAQLSQQQQMQQLQQMQQQQQQQQMQQQQHQAQKSYGGGASYGNQRQQYQQQSGVPPRQYNMNDQATYSSSNNIGSVGGF